MKKTTLLLSLLASLSFAVPAVAADQCPELARTASKLAQDYRLAVGKVRTACDSSFEECRLSRARANDALLALGAANDAMLAVCQFINPTTDDALPVTTETVLAAIETLPTSVLVPCQTFNAPPPLGEVSVGCRSGGGWAVNIPRTIVNVTPSGAMSFDYGVTVGVSASIPVDSSYFRCTVSVSTSAGVPVAGSAVFWNAVAGGTTNRLQLTANSANTSSLGLDDACGALGDIFELTIKPFVIQATQSALTTALSATFCGAVGPALFGTCP